MKLKTIFQELLWLVGVFVIFWLGIFYAVYHFIDDDVMKMGIFHLQFDLSLNDTYLVVKGPVIFVPVFIMVILVYLVKEAFHHYTRRFQNIVMLLAHALLLYQLVYLMQLGDLFAHQGGWTIYPPLSALPQPNPVYPLGPTTAWCIFRGIILFFILSLSFVSFITGKNWNKNINA